MKKELKDTKSLEKYYQTVLQIITWSENTVVSRGEIETMMVNNLVCNKRLVTNILKALVTNGTLIRQRIRGQKRNGYVINEEIISGKMNESYVTVDVTKKGLPIYDKLTQTELQREMKGVIRRYKKAIGNKKSDINNNLELFFVIHTYFLTLCLGWIARLTLSIYGGVFHDKGNKIFLARKNIEMLQEFIGLMLLKVQEKNPDNYDMFLTSMHNFFEYLDPFENTVYSRKSLTTEKLIEKALPQDD